VKPWLKRSLLVFALAVPGLVYGATKLGASSSEGCPVPCPCPCDK
jgi:hypothetical protein